MNKESRKSRNDRNIIRVRKLLEMALLTMIALLGITGCQSADTKLPDTFDEETVKEACMKSIELFNERDYQGLRDMGSQELKDSVTAEELKKQCNPYLDKCGEFQKIEKTVIMGNEDKKTGAKYGGAVMVGAYKDGKIQFTIGFDEDMKLVQFIIK